MQLSDPPETVEIHSLQVARFSAESAPYVRQLVRDEQLTYLRRCLPFATGGFVIWMAIVLLLGVVRRGGTVSQRLLNH